MKPRYKIYLAHPISGLSYDEVMKYYQSVETDLWSAGYELLIPMAGKDFLHNVKVLAAEGYNYPQSTANAIVGRDSWMVQTADVVYVDLCGSRTVSIGCCMELAWAHLLNKHTVVSMDADDIYRHAFVMGCSDVILDSHKEAIDYLLKLIGE